MYNNNHKIRIVYMFVISFLILLLAYSFPISATKKINTDYINRKTNEKVVYITFDDGPTNNMYKILDILEKYDAKVTFFFGASKLSTYRHQAKAAIEKGHKIGSHSFSHIADEVYSSIESFKKDISLWQMAFNKELGFIPNFYRFPYGSNSRYIYIKNDPYCLSRLAIKVLNEMGVKYVDWSVTSGDGTEVATADEICEKVILGIDEIDNPVILLHEWNDKSISVLDKILEYGRQKGYKFNSLEEYTKLPQFVQ